MFRFPGFRRDATVPRDPDEIAVERYRYLLRTAPPEQIEQAHREAFEQLTPEQRRLALQALAPEVDPREMHTADDSPESLARVATRAEMRQPGTLERAFGGRQQAGWGGGGGFMGSFLPMLAGAFVGTSIANMLFADHGYPEGDPGSDGAGAETADAGSDGGSAEGGSWDDGSTADAGADFGDFGGGDFGGF